MIFSYNKWSILNAPTHVDFKAPIDNNKSISEKFFGTAFDRKGVGCTKRV